MGYDFSFFRPAGPGPMSTWPAERPPPLGTEAEVKARREEIFPGIRWRAPSGRLGTWDAGDDHAPFLVAPEPDGTRSPVQPSGAPSSPSAPLANGQRFQPQHRSREIPLALAATSSSLRPHVGATLRRSSTKNEQ